MNILIIEDDPTLSRNISEVLEAEGFVTASVYDGTLAEKMLKRESYDCIIMDINLPGITGYDLCKGFRIYNKDTPVLMLTAFNELEDKIKGYDSGADDYLTKPFFMRELVLRIRSLMKRAGNTKGTIADNNIFTAGDITILDTQKKVTRQGKPVELTPREYQILLMLCKHHGEIVSKADLVKEIWGSTFDANTNTIEVYINFLRNKLDKPFGTQSIKTKVGYGYYLDV
ncbi:response regulator transcription factor [Polluticaenibacter yanchengensis]|uniref:Response regulator transcription factor n=1 Tax=Polluticaenibacter yanchengensis TaxID=3014562 RepID=A0ABT4UIA8_9BACT|nr:response regulator transcription factor [Chitinophagaceae bacterium LY-5]